VGPEGLAIILIIIVKLVAAVVLVVQAGAVEVHLLELVVAAHMAAHLEPMVLEV
jgi:hypothetical protein